MKGLSGFLKTLALGSIALLIHALIAPALFAPAAAAEAPALPELNRHLAAALAGARAALGAEGDGANAAACLAEDQKRWEQEVRIACGSNADCLRRVTLERLAALDGLQPEASRVTAFDLPKVPVLVTALPPAQNAASQHSLSAGTPFAVIGTLIHEQEDAQNMGLAIRSPAGRSVLLVPDTDIGNSPAHTALQSAMRANPDTTYRASGQLDPTTGGLALNHCRFIYQWPEE